MMSAILGTPPRGTQSTAAAFFASPTSPVPRRPDAAGAGDTPTSVASSNLRGVSSPLSQRRQHLLQQQQRPPRASLTPHSSLDRYVSAPTRQTSSLAHFLLTSTEHKTPMLIRAAQQHQLALRSASREASLSHTYVEEVYPSPTRYAVDHSSPDRGAASPRPHGGSQPRAGSTRLSGVFAKMHLDPSIRSSRDRSVSAASGVVEAGMLRGGGVMVRDDDDGDQGTAGSPPSFSIASSNMEVEPYTTKLARTLFSDVSQSTVLRVNDTATRPTASMRSPGTPLSPTVSDPAGRGQEISAHRLGDDEDDDGSGGDGGMGGGRYARFSAFDSDHDEGEENGVVRRRLYDHPGRESDGDDDLDTLLRIGGRGEREQQQEEEDEEAERRGGGNANAENVRRRGPPISTVSFTSPRLPLASSHVNLHGASEAARYDASLGVVFECNRTRNFTSPSFRVIPHTPERILDAADMEDDFYMNLIDWSAASDVLCVALQSCVYLWDAKTCGITELPRVTASTLGDTRSASAQLVCGLNWAPDGRRLAVGRNTGMVEVWDVETQQVVHAYRQHTDRTVSLAWEPLSGGLLASGSRDSTIVLRDVRERDTSASSFMTSSSSFSTPPPPPSSSRGASATAVLRGHETEVCGLKWAPNGTMLASGGNDNQLLLWDRRAISTGMSGGESHGASGSPYGFSHAPQPVFSLNKHTAAVKALSWNPAQPALLVSGGGSHDKSLRFWNTLTGECVHHINTGSQVCGVVWNRSGTELVTAHGYTDNQLSIWRYPSLRRIANLIGHTSRVLHLALSADGETVVSAAGDETLRFWRCFPPSELRDSSPHLYRSFYSPSSVSSLSGSPYAAGAGGAGSSSVSGSAARARAAAVAAGRCGSASPDRDQLAFMNEEVELR